MHVHLLTFRAHFANVDQFSSHRPGLEIERQDLQLGPLNAILHSKSEFVVCATDPSCHNVASQLCRNLFQYFAADSYLYDGLPDSIHLSKRKGNFVSLGSGKKPAGMTSSHLPIKLDNGKLWLVGHDGLHHSYDWMPGVGVIFLSPLPEHRLEMKIYGWDETALRQAARLFPLLTGTGQPEFIILDRSCAWRGATAALAMGSLTSLWEVSEGSYLT